MAKYRKTGIIICAVLLACAAIYFILRATIWQPRSGPDGIKDSDGYIRYLRCVDDKVWFVHSLFDGGEVLYCYDDETGLNRIDTDDADLIVQEMKDEAGREKIITNNAGMEYKKEEFGYIPVNRTEIKSDAEYRYAGQEDNTKEFPNDKYELSEYYYGLTDEYAVGLMLAAKETEEEYNKADENNGTESGDYAGYIALVDNMGNVSVIPGYAARYSAGFIYCSGNCIYFWGYPDTADDLHARLYAYVVDTGEVRKLCDYGNICDASDLDYEQWRGGGDEDEVFIDNGCLYSYSSYGDTDIIRFRLTYDDDGYPVSCEYDACIYANPHLR